mgnify:FL=1
MSNTREARFSRDGSEVYTGIESTDSVSDTKPSEPAMGGEK